MVKNVVWFDNCVNIWKYLIFMDLNVCKDVLDILVLKIVDMLFFMEYFSIFGCKGISIVIWKKMVKKLLFLKYFDIS